MPSNFSKRKKFVKRKPRKKKGAMEPMGIRGMVPTYSTIVPILNEPTMTSDILTAESLSHSFAFNDIINFSNYAMFDQYRLNWVEIKVIPTMVGMVTTDADVTGPISATERIPNYCFWVDRDDITLAVTYDELRVRQGAVVRKATQSYTRKFRPNILSNTFNGLSPDGHQIVKEPAWIDTGNISLPHYGFKMVLQAGGSATNQYVLRVQMRYCYSFANRRT